MTHSEFKLPGAGRVTLPKNSYCPPKFKLHHIGRVILLKKTKLYHSGRKGSPTKIKSSYPGRVISPQNQIVSSQESHDPQKF